MTIFTIHELIDSCEEYDIYPENIVERKPSIHRVKSYIDRLRTRADHLFDKELSKLNVIETTENDQDFQKVSASSLEDLRTLLFAVSSGGNRNPTCRFFFIHAPQSRASLRISWDMFAYLFSYYQIPPVFLDFIFPFGDRIGASHHDVSGLRNESRVYAKQKGPEISLLSRSGHDVRICYSLRSVEKSPKQVPLPWSIRQTAVYLSFDLLTGHTTWVNVKGNQLLENRIEEEHMLATSAASAESLFAASLAAHMVFVEWAGEDWRWYINDLEAQIQGLMMQTIAAPVQQSPPSPADSHRESYSRSSILTASEKCKMPASPTKSTFGLNRANALEGRSRGRKQPPELPPTIGVVATGAPFGSDELNQGRFLDHFSFSDLQFIQYIEEKVGETILVLSFNLCTLRDLRRFYNSLCRHEEFSTLVHAKEVEMFELQVIKIEVGLDTQIMRSQTLLTKLRERKALLNSILQYRSMKASEFFANKAQQSSDSVETITSQMHTIAIQTQRETVSMRIITLVTLFFLPGTFVATFMSTDILRWTDARRVFSSEALYTYLGISLPMMAITFSAWYLLYRFSRRSEYRVKRHHTPGFA